MKKLKKKSCISFLSEDEQFYAVTVKFSDGCELFFRVLAPSESVVESYILSRYGSDPTMTEYYIDSYFYLPF